MGKRGDKDAVHSPEGTNIDTEEKVVLVERKRSKANDGKATSTSKTVHDGTTLSNVVYLGHIPHGFYEKQMREYFTQFGHVVNLRLSRNKKTGKSKHYAFIQFHSSDIASVVAEAMDGYHFFGQKLDARVMKKEEIHDEIFKGANRVFKRIPWKDIEVKRHNKQRNAEEEQRRQKRVARRNAVRSQKIKNSGIEYTFDPAPLAMRTEENLEAKASPTLDKELSVNKPKQRASTHAKDVRPSQQKMGNKLSPPVTRSRAKLRKKT